MVTRPETAAVLREAIQSLVLMLAPFTPHMCEELWKRLGDGRSIVTATWPVADEEAAKDEEIEIPVQVNGKLRGRVTLPADAAESENRRWTGAAEGGCLLRELAPLGGRPRSRARRKTSSTFMMLRHDRARSGLPRRRRCVKPRRLSWIRRGCRRCASTPLKQDDEAKQVVGLRIACTVSSWNEWGNNDKLPIE